MSSSIKSAFFVNKRASFINCFLCPVIFTAAVEGCLSHGLRRRALGLFRSSSTTALMHKVAKGYPPALVISKLIMEADACEGVK